MYKSIWTTTNSQNIIVFVKYLNNELQENLKFKFFSKTIKSQIFCWT